MAPRLRRFALRTAVAIAAVAALAGAAVWLAGTEAALRWAAERAVAASGGRLQVEGVSGSLLATIEVERLAYRDEAVEIDARGVRASWLPLSLLAKRVEVLSASAREVAIRIPPGDATSPATLPGDIGLPIPVDVRKATVSHLSLEAAAQTFVIERATLAYHGGPDAHRVSDLRAHGFDATFEGTASLGATPPFVIAGRVDATRLVEPVPGHARIEAGGTLDAIRLAVEAEAGKAGRAKAMGTIAAFEPTPLSELALGLEQVDLAALDAALPATEITATIGARGDASGALIGTLSVINAASGPIDKGRLPVERIDSPFATDWTTLRLTDLGATLGGDARITGAAEIAPGGTTLDLAVERVDLRTLHTALARTRLSGRIEGTVRGDEQSASGKVRDRDLELAFDATRQGNELTINHVDARARGGALTGKGRVTLSGNNPFSVEARVARFDPSAFGDFPSGSLNGTLAVEGVLAKDWRAAGSFVLEESRLRDARLTGKGTLDASRDRIANADIALAAGSNHLAAKGSFGREGDELAIHLDAPQLGVLAKELGGRASLTARVGGTASAPRVRFSAAGSNLRWKDGAQDVAIGSIDATGTFANAADAPLALELTARDVRRRDLALADAEAKLAGTLTRHSLDASLRGGDIDASIALEGGWDVAQGWRGTLVRFVNRGTYPVELTAPAPLAAAKDRASLGPLEARIGSGRVVISEFQWADGRITSRGEFDALPATMLIALAGRSADLASTVTLAGDWSVLAAPRLNGSFTVRRQAGDLTVLADSPIALGIQRFELEGRFREDALSASLAATSAVLGEGAARLEVLPAAEGLATESPISLEAKARLASLRPLGRFLSRTVLIDGTLALDMAGSGTLGRPRLLGTLEGDAISIELPSYGVDLRDGRVRAKLTESAIEVADVSIRGGDGRFTASGVLPRGERPAGARIDWQARDFRVAWRPDLRLIVSGQGAATADEYRIRLQGDIRAEQGYVEFGPSEVPELGPDVVVKGREPTPRREALRVPVELDLGLDFGEHFAIRGRGLDARLGGTLRVTTSPRGSLQAKGAIETRAGTYRAYGQNLRIERGRLFFEGPIEDPGLDIEAWRRNQTVEAGVKVSGTVRRPRVQLVSEPPVPDQEKLAWLVLGRGLSGGSASQADLAALQIAAATLLASDGEPVGRRVLREIGIDELSFRDGGSGLQGQIVQVGRRLSDDVLLFYEQTLDGVGSVVKLDFQLTRRLAVRGETGTRSGIGLVYRHQFD